MALTALPRSILFRTALLSSSLPQPIVKPLLNKNLVAFAWVGSYKIRDPSAYLDRFPKPKRWPRYNEIVQPPQKDPKEERRPATYYHYVENVKYSPKKMWYVMKFIRGMNIDEAIKQLKFVNNKGSQIVAEILEQAQEKAVKEHNFEFKSNMWVDEAHAVKGLVIKGLRKHARMRFGSICYFYCHICVKLTEGEPPVHFHRPVKDGNDHLKDFYDELRSRKVIQGL